MDRTNRRRALLGAAALSLLAVFFAVRTRAGDPAPSPAQAPKIESKFLRGLAGRWDTEASEGVIGHGKGRSTWQLTLGDTAIVEDYETKLTGADGVTRESGAHVVVREKGDGKTIEAWMFDDSGIPPKHFVGSYTDAGFEAKAETPEGVVRVTCEAKGADRIFRLHLGDTLLVVETYRPAAK